MLVEKHVVEACLASLRRRGYRPIRLQSGKFRTLDGQRIVTVGEPGIPDYVAVHPRLPAFFLETKRPGGELSEVQQTKIWELTKGYGFSVVVADRIEVFLPWLEKYEARHLEIKLSTTEEIDALK